MPAYILASASPRRAALLRQIGLDFSVCIPDTDESAYDHLPPPERVAALAGAKLCAAASSFADRQPDTVLIAADTLVVLDGAVLGKPYDSEDAKRMLRLLSGRVHAVHTGIAAARLDEPERILCDTVSAEVAFRRLTDAEIDAYVATGEPLDKAGAYGIQEGKGALLGTLVRGDYYAVVGLPLCRLGEMLEDDDAKDTVQLAAIKEVLDRSRLKEQVETADNTVMLLPVISTMLTPQIRQIAIRLYGIPAVDGPEVINCTTGPIWPIPIQSSARPSPKKSISMRL